MKQTFFLLFFFLILIAPNVLAVKSVPQVGEFETGLTVRFPTVQSVKKDVTIKANFHVYNKTNGVPIVESVSCYLHLFNGSGEHILKDEVSTVEHDFDYVFEIDKGNFSEIGEGSYLISCNNSEVGGFASGSFKVTQTGSDEENIYFTLLVFLIPLIFGFFTLLGSFFLGDDHKEFKVGLFLFSLMTFFVSMWFAYIVVAVQFPNFEGLLNALGRLTWLFGIMIIVFVVYFMIYILYKAFRQSAQEERDRDIEY